MAGAATVEKALDVLFHLHDAAVPLGLSEIGRALDLPKSSCHRLLASLAKREMVERDEVGHYRPGTPGSTACRSWRSRSGRRRGGESVGS